MKNPSSKTPVSSFVLPPNPPKNVAAAIAKFDQVADQWGASQGEISDAEDAAKSATAAAVRAAVAAAKDGKDAAPEIERVEREHAATIAALRQKLATLTVAVDEQGNEMALAVAVGRQEWLDRLDPVAAEAELRFAAAIADARAALTTLGAARGAVEWLSSFDHTRARIGDAQQFTRTRMFCNTRMLQCVTDEDPLRVLDVLAHVASERESLYRQAASVNATATTHRFPVAS